MVVCASRFDRPPWAAWLNAALHVGFPIIIHNTVMGEARINQAGGRKPRRSRHDTGRRLKLTRWAMSHCEWVQEATSGRETSDILRRCARTTSAVTCTTSEAANAARSRQGREHAGVADLLSRHNKSHVKT